MTVSLRLSGCACVPGTAASTRANAEPQSDTVAQQTFDGEVEARTPSVNNLIGQVCCQHRRGSRRFLRRSRFTTVNVPEHGWWRGVAAEERTCPPVGKYPWCGYDLADSLIGSPRPHRRPPRVAIRPPSCDSPAVEVVEVILDGWPAVHRDLLDRVGKILAVSIDCVGGDPRCDSPKVTYPGPALTPPATIRAITEKRGQQAHRRTIELGREDRGRTGQHAQWPTAKRTTPELFGTSQQPETSCDDFFGGDTDEGKANVGMPKGTIRALDDGRPSSRRIASDPHAKDCRATRMLR